MPILGQRELDPEALQLALLSILETELGVLASVFCL